MILPEVGGLSIPHNRWRKKTVFSTAISVNLTDKIPSGYFQADIIETPDMLICRIVYISGKINTKIFDSDKCRHLRYTSNTQKTDCVYGTDTRHGERSPMHSRTEKSSVYPATHTKTGAAVLYRTGKNNVGFFLIRFSSQYSKLKNSLPPYTI